MADAKFAIGQVIKHRLFDYRGVIYDVDADFQGTEDWYRQMAKSRPPRDRPWYRILVHDGHHETYVAERNLESDGSGDPVRHPLVDQVFDAFVDGAYRSERNVN